MRVVITPLLAAARGLEHSALLAGLLDTAEGREVLEGHVAGRLSRLDLAAFAAACRAGRDYRRERVEGGEEELLTLNDNREAYQSAGELRAGLSLGLPDRPRPNEWCLAIRVAEYGTAEALAWVLDNTDPAVVRRECGCIIWWITARAHSERVEKLEVLLPRFPVELNGEVYTCVWAAQHGHMDALVFR